MRIPTTGATPSQTPKMADVLTDVRKVGLSPPSTSELRKLSRLRMNPSASRPNPLDHSRGPHPLQPQSQPARRHHAREAEQHDGAHYLAVLAGRLTELPAQLQSDNRHDEAQEPEQGHGQNDGVAHRSQCEPYREIVQAKCGAADQQPPPMPDLRGVVVAPQRLDEPPDCGRAEYPGAGPAGGGPQRPGQAGADENPRGRHDDIAQA